MLTHPSRPDTVSVIRDYRTWYNDAKLPGCRGKPPDLDGAFVPSTDVEAYIRAPQTVERLLDALFPGEDLGRPDADAIRQTCPKVFCILLCNDHGHLINHLIQHQYLSDRRLPFTESDLASAIDDQDICSSFIKRQGEFCASEFQNRSFAVLDKRHSVLPIIQVEKLGDGGSAVIHKITLHEAYDQLQFGTHRRRPIENTDPTHGHTYVLKTYYQTKDAYIYYRNEVNAFKRLHPFSNIVDFYGSFERHGTYNVLLEYANLGTLEDYFKKTPPPSTGEAIITFWDGLLLGVLKALKRIHSSQSESQPDGPHIFRGIGKLNHYRWHQDIKPRNILVTTMGQEFKHEVEFLVADLGLSHFKRKVPSDTVARDTNAHGSRTYGAPECCGPENDPDYKPLEVNQDVDIWSASCVLSEAAAWLVHGYDFLLEYRRQRTLEKKAISDLNDGDCFHDGYRVLEAVHRMHDDLSQNKRRSDHITLYVVEMVREMMQPEESRPSAKTLVIKSKNIIDRARLALDQGQAGASSGQTTAYNRILERDPKRPMTPPVLPAGYGPQGQAHRSPQETQHIAMPAVEINGSAHVKNTVSQQSPATNIGHANLTKAPLSTKQLSREKSLEIFSSTCDKVKRIGHALDASCKGNNEKHVLDSFQQRLDPSADLDSHRSTQSSTATSTSQPPPLHQFLRRRDLQRDSKPKKRRPSDQRKKGEILNTQAQPVSPETPSQPERPPRLSVHQAKTWKIQKKTSKNAGEYDLGDDPYLGKLQNHDFIFLIDDAGSMAKHWVDVRDLFGLLAYMIKKHDKDGLDLYLTSSDERRHDMNTSKLLKHLDAHRPAGQSDMSDRLGSILQDYRAKLDAKARPRKFWEKPLEVRRLVIYVFTDAIWQPICHVDQPIRTMVDYLDQHGLRNAQVGIQFIRFGADQQGIERLQYLDQGLKSEIPQDIVDTEPANGCVRKMLLGPINSWFDYDPDIMIASAQPASSTVPPSLVLTTDVGRNSLQGPSSQSKPLDIDGDRNYDPSSDDDD